MRRELLVTGIGNIIPLSPVAHRIKVDVDKGRHKIALITKGNDFLDLGEKLELVLKELRRKHTAVIQLADILGAVDDSEMTLVIEVARIAGVHPVVRGLGLGGRLGILEVFLKDARTAVHHLAVLLNPHLYTRRGRSDAFRTHNPVRLHSDKDRGLGLAVELLKVDAQRPVELENLGTNGFTGSISNPDPTQAKGVL